MYTVLDKDMIELEIVPYLATRKRGFSPTVPLAEIVNAILYKLKTGVQWRQLPVKALFEDQVLSWQSVYYHYRKWCVTEALENCWIEFLKRHKSSFDLSSVDLDGSHTPAIRGGANVEYQGRKKRKTTPEASGPYILPIGKDCHLLCLNRCLGTIMICTILKFNLKL